MGATADDADQASALATRLGMSTGQTVQELGYDTDTDDLVADAVIAIALMGFLIALIANFAIFFVAPKNLFTVFLTIFLTGRRCCLLWFVFRTNFVLILSNSSFSF